MKLKKITNKTISPLRKLSRRQKLIFITFGFAIVCAVVYWSVILKNEDPISKEQEPNPINLSDELPKPSGGDPQLFSSYYQQALDAWRAGDKPKAKELAQKGLDLNEQLKPEEQAQLSSQSRMVYDLYDITKDLYDEN